ncbi:MAG TPA: hypothetical protein V6D19_09005 [Stenomitos sp.]
MNKPKLHLELLLGTQVIDVEGKAVGQIEKIADQQQGKDCYIQEYLIGSTAILERLSAWYIGTAIQKVLGAHKFRVAGYRISGDQLDLSAPRHPRLRCTRNKLMKLSTQLEQSEQ